MRDHDATLDRICRFMGVDYTAQMLDYASDTDYRAPSMRLAGDWRDALSARDVQLIEARTGLHRLIRAGFEPSGLEPIEVTDAQLRRLAWHDRLGRVVRRAEYYGVGLTAAEMCARVLGIGWLERRLQPRLLAAQAARRKKSWSESAKYRTSR